MNITYSPFVMKKRSLGVYFGAKTSNHYVNVWGRVEAMLNELGISLDITEIYNEQLYRETNDDLEKLGD